MLSCRLHCRWGAAYHACYPFVKGLGTVAFLNGQGCGQLPLLPLQSDASLRASFDGWQSDFGQSFQPGTAEYDQRLAIFKNTLQVRSVCRETKTLACACASAGSTPDTTTRQPSWCAMQRMVAFNQQPGITYWVAPNRWSALTFDEFAAAVAVHRPCSPLYVDRRAACVCPPRINRR